MAEGRTVARGTVVFVLLDAFRHDYLGRTRFLADLARRSLVGRLEEPFGFCPRAAYFGGLTPARQGFTNLMHYDPAGSVFRWTREIAGTGRDDVLLGDLRAVIVEEARKRLPEFAAACVDPLAIPLDRLSCFDVSERHAPWDREVGYRSLFHLLDDERRPWMEVSWPFRGLGPGADSATVAGEALRRMARGQDFAYLHLPSLDALGHEHGPGSIRVQAAIEETDRLCERIVARALELHEDPILLFAGDHGMLPVVRNVDVMAVLDGLGLRFGHDFAHFVDSTMVRCWFFSASARRATHAALEATGAGRWIDPCDRERWGLAGLPGRNGEAFFLAHPGVAFAPSCFVGRGQKPPLGMHGYAPEVVDNQAVLLVHRPRAPRAGEVGVVNARRLFPTVLRWLGLDPSRFTTEAPIDEAVAAPGPSRWTRSRAVGADALVERHLARAVEAIRTRSPDTEAILLTGGFGRGEGTVTAEGGTVRVHNDYDLLALGGDAAALTGLGEELAREFGMEFVDVGAQAGLEPVERPSQLHFDLRHGSTVLWGDAGLPAALPSLAPASIPADEGVYLLGNRFGGLALVAGAGPGERFAEPGFAAHQVAKLLLAVVDAWLLELGDYHASYAVRRTRFFGLAPAAGFEAEVLAGIEAAFAYKLEGVAPGPVRRPVGLALAALGRAFGWADPGARLGERLDDVIRSRAAVPAGWIDRVAALGLVPNEHGRSDIAGASAALYKACVEIALASEAGTTAFADADRSQTLATHWLRGPGFAGARSVAAAWLAQFH